MKTSEIRQTFLKFFESKGHTIVHSSPVVPGNDPTLLFTNAGMNQFKDVFLGFDKRAYSRATTAQKCIRAGGKHNDLDNVGYTARHHTFFEMLGNFSFGDYFKRDAIKYAWELLTVHFKLPAEKLWVTVYAEDDEAFDIWNKEVGVPAERIVRIGDNKGARYMSDNFWMMGDTGPCGPCSEIFYDHGEEIAGGPPGSPDEDGDRFIEIWNLVFMQFNRDEEGVMHKLPNPSIDTGMGLERISAVLQHVHNNYDIDLFVNLLAAVRRAVEEAGATNVDPKDPSLKVIADHIRACTFSVADGIVPGNEGRAYVLRRICRRAIRHGYKLGARRPFFAALSKAVAAEMGEAYPEIKDRRIEEVLLREETRFTQTLAQGMAILEDAVAKTEGKVLSGEVAFKLHDTYGFPVDLTADALREKGMTVDMQGFDACMAVQREKARASAKFKMAAGLDYQGPSTVFTGYESVSEKDTKVVALFADGQAVDALEAGDEGVVILDKTPFYAESGGQIGDTGVLKNAMSLARVLDTQKVKAQVFGMTVHVEEGRVALGDAFEANVEAARRRAIVRNHSAAHLLHYALRSVLGKHVEQRGSWVGPDFFRFDFSHDSAMTDAQIREVEAVANDLILSNFEAKTEIMDIEAAKSTGAMMLFGEKYGDKVRVLTMGPSVELCGGTHVARTGDIGSLHVVAESAIAAGIRRIEVVTGMKAVSLARDKDDYLVACANAMKAPVDKVLEKGESLFETVKARDKEVARLNQEIARLLARDLARDAEEGAGFKYLVREATGIDAKNLRDLAESVRDALGSSVVFLGLRAEGKVQFVAAVSKDMTSRVKAGELASEAASAVDGRGGGKPDLAMAGGAKAEGFNAALEAILARVRAL